MDQGPVLNLEALFSSSAEEGPHSGRKSVIHQGAGLVAAPLSGTRLTSEAFCPAFSFAHPPKACSVSTHLTPGSRRTYE